ncbi:MAG: hypothetical protein CMJ81_16500 [Planctomycetaceae bacterium]|nr:hypothetical protein [Planctomycetaceae bacterium]
MKFRSSIRLVRLLALLMAVNTSVSATDLKLHQLEEEALQAAVARVAPSVVQIAAFGGQQRVGRHLVGTSPTTGLVVSEDGLIVSSEFNFIQNPSSILVTTASGQRIAARILARDHSKNLVLLQAEANHSWTVPQAVPVSQMSVGQWAIAVGRTFDEGTSGSVGILSATNRIWGKAIQTDAKVSPNNYGGPLIDIQGRVLGVVAPMSPHTRDKMAGSEWYDSGIGFAVPLVDVYDQLDRWKTGHDLSPGVMGISLKGDDMFTLPAEIAASLPNSPARSAGLESGDTIVQINGKHVERQVHLKHLLGPLYAGDEVQLVVERNGHRLEKLLTLVDQITPYEFPFLGILPRRDSGDRLFVRWVFPGSPAEQCGLQVDDEVTHIAEKPVAGVQQAWEVLAALEQRKNVRILVNRKGTHHVLVTSLTSLSKTTAETLPAAEPKASQVAERHANTGIVDIKVPEVPNECFAYVSEQYDTAKPAALVVWLTEPGENNRESLLTRWKDSCQQHNVILLAPQPADPKRWQRTEIDFVRKCMDHILTSYEIDRTRVVVHGYEAGGTLAYWVAFSHLDIVRAVAAIDTSLPSQLRPPATDPLHRLSILATTSSTSPAAMRINQSLKVLALLKYPLFVHDRNKNEGVFNSTEQAMLVRWIDALDRI